ncbi:MAG TPA: alpha/beta fold hydrolase [Kofleriaceae bacterium]|nr:alpha/beta fold hydrolase [Kofleriaceae bacterium]
MPRPPAPLIKEFTHDGRRVSYAEHGSGPRVLVLTHGLLMDRRMYTALAPAVAARGHRVITVDMVGHGSSDQPLDMSAHTMTQYGSDVIALLDHLGVDQAVIGGTSLGANVSLEAAVAAPERVRALVLEMPVLEHGIVAAAAVFVPLAIALRVGKRNMARLARLLRLVPRSHFLVDVFIDFVRRDPLSSLAVLDGLTFGRIAPPAAVRKQLRHPTLIIGHRADPIHPFSDAEFTARELPNARLLAAKSIYEWRLSPRRLTDELCRFLDDVWSRPVEVAAAS